jgi:hypothetical protein
VTNIHVHPYQSARFTVSGRPGAGCTNLLSQPDLPRSSSLQILVPVDSLSEGHAHRIVLAPVIPALYPQLPILEWSIAEVREKPLRSCVGENEKAGR